jgi:hypothetical protein
MRDPLPHLLFARATSVGDLSRYGFGRRELAGPLWLKPFHGVRLWSGQDPANEIIRIGNTLPLLPSEGALGGWAAARMSGVHGLDGLGPDLAPLPVDHVLPVKHHLEDLPGIRRHRELVAPAELIEVGRTHLTSPARTAVDMARWADGLVEAVVALDVVLHAGWVTVAELEAQLAAMPRRRGIPQARAALALADAGAESQWETRLRMRWVIDAELPPLLVNPWILTSSGIAVARGDLLDVEAGMVLEYDGSHHRELDQHRADNLREERLERMGLRVIRFTVRDVTDVDAAVTRMRLERAARIGRDTCGETWRYEVRRGCRP